MMIHGAQVAEATARQRVSPSSAPLIALVSSKFYIASVRAFAVSATHDNPHGVSYAQSVTHPKSDFMA
jgi:hypothetical protein